MLIEKELNKQTNTKKIWNNQFNYVIILTIWHCKREIMEFIYIIMWDVTLFEWMCADCVWSKVLLEVSICFKIGMGTHQFYCT